MIFDTIITYAEPAKKALSATPEVVESTRSGLGLNPMDIAFYLLCFVVAMVILNNVLFKPLLKILEERESRINASFDEMEAMETKIANADNQSKSIIAKAHSDARSIIEDAKAQVEPVKAQVIADAEVQAHEIVSSANIDADKIISNAKANADKEVAGLVQKIIQKATSNLHISGPAQNEILGSIINTKL